MNEHRNDISTVGRPDFFKVAGAGLTAAGALLTPRGRAVAQGVDEKARLERIAGCTWPIRQLFKTRQAGGRGGSAVAGAGGGPTPQRIPTVPANRDRSTTAEMRRSIAG